MSENLTNRELLSNAMPLFSLSRTEWNTFIKHIEQIEHGSDFDLLKVLCKLKTNQSRLEVMSNYCGYFGDVLNETVPEESAEVTFVL